MKGPFEKGELNPNLVVQAVRLPRYFSETLDLNHPAAADWTRRMAHHFRRIHAVTSRVLVLSIPYGLYVNRTEYEGFKADGFEVDDFRGIEHEFHFTPLCLTR